MVRTRIGWLRQTDSQFIRLSRFAETGDHDGHKNVLDRLRTAAKNKNREIGACIKRKKRDMSTGK